jgi:plastocyanin
VIHRTLPALLGCAASAALLTTGCGSNAGGSGSATGTPTPTTESNSTVAAPPAHAKGPVRSGLVQIRYENIAVNPAAVTVRVGTQIRWTNFDTVDHNVTTQGSGPANFASKSFGPGNSYTYKVRVPGVIRYLCTIHPASMSGSITVVKK